MIVSPKVGYLGSALAGVADALNVLYDLGERVDIRFGTVMTDFGYVICDENGRWTVRMKVGEPPESWSAENRDAIDDE